MRVISGKYKGRKLEGFNIDGTRPTMDRIKESLFASIQNYLPDSVVLDLFAGSGALGIEALSNGSKSCVFVDHNPEVIKVLKRNTDAIDGVNIMYDDYAKALMKLANNHVQFDIILLDPPYKLNLINDCLDKIYNYNLLKKQGIIVCEFDGEKVTSNYFEEIKCKKYASKCIIVYKRVK